ncbi:hypothetical protein [Arsenophonus endosymbiont of Bemisia tabaci]|uniref:hypothetical protein n=1 Tax=Arsenophonus endosymbiont of Bemisia tabaci TaxID=536059 RepID=UPI0015F63962|nr:hypothetical protein [Arsenophonus endosymbiont of Bemisia tabaci]CAA2931067.1 hypothetical protein ARSQ2_02214 [Arsenophonus endosymbiont of Bemisia tabaci Q2]
MNAPPKKQAKKPHPLKVAKQQPKKVVEKSKQEVKVKIPKPPTPPKKRLPLEEAISQISTFWPNLLPENQLKPMKISIQQGYVAGAEGKVITDSQKAFKSLSR